MFCKACQTEKDISEFQRDKQTKSGYRYECKLCRNKKIKLNSENVKASNRKKYLKHKVRIRQNCNKYYLQNREQLLKYAKEYRDKNKDIEKQKSQQRLPKRRANRKKRYDSDILFKLKSNMRSRIWEAFKAKSWKKDRTQAIIGCTFQEAKDIIEQKFTDDMSWNNYGQWHIDHKIPISSAKTKEELLALCHISNLQPLWAMDNIKKSNKII